MAIYLLNSEGVSLHKNLDRRMCYIGFNIILSDPDTWINTEVNTCGYNNYLYLTTWVDYGMNISDGT